MSHSKYVKRGYSYHFDSYGSEAKRFIVVCAGCGKQGFRPSVLEEGFANTLSRKVIRMNLEEALEPLHLNDARLCAECARNVENIAQQGNSDVQVNRGKIYD